mgnify:CR=1 FL=1
MILDDRFLEGLYYDAQYGDIVRLDRDEKAGVVIILSPDREELDRVDPVDFDEGDMYPVPELAVDDPATFMANVYEDALEVDALDVREWAGYMYASDRTTLVEVEP